MQKFIRMAATLAVLVSATLLLAQENHGGYVVKELQGRDQSRNCIFFTLEGVSVADSAVSNGRHFAVPDTHPGFQDIFSILLAASVSQQEVFVSTTGVAACGSAAVNMVRFSN